MKMPDVLKSKKFLVFISGVLTVVFKDVLELDPEQVNALVKIIMAYCLGQGVADLGKEQAKIEKG